MSRQVTVSFTCPANTATLLMTLYELLSMDIRLDTSILGTDNFDWLVDEIASRAEEALEAKLAGDGKPFAPAAMALVEFEQRRRKRTA